MKICNTRNILYLLLILFFLIVILLPSKGLKGFERTTVKFEILCGQVEKYRA